jgi:SAM-dependent methyltransferase
MNSVVVQERTPWFHRYPGRFPPSVALEMLTRIKEELTFPPELVLDPFVGTGTALSCLAQNGIPSVGLEINPLAMLVCSVRFSPPSNIVATAESLLEMAANCKDEEPEWAESDVELSRWMGAKNVNQLRSLMNRIDRNTDAPQRNWMRLAVSSSLRSASVWLSGSIKPQRDPNRIPAPFSESLRRSVSALKRDSLLEPNPSAAIGVLFADACAIPIRDNSVDAVLTSPPYLTMYDYFDVQRLSFLAFGWKRSSDLQIGRQSEISPDGVAFVPPSSLERWYRDVCKGEQSIEGRAIRLYSQRMEAAVREQVRVLRPGGVACYAIADSVRREGVLELTRALCELVERSGLKVMRVLPRRTSHRRILPAGRDPQTGRFSSSSGMAGVPEQIIIAMKEPC